MLRRISRSFVRPQAQKCRRFAWTIFPGRDGLEPEIGPSDSRHPEAERNAADSLGARGFRGGRFGKIGRSSLSLIAPITSIHGSTDSGIAAHHRADLEAKGIEVVAVSGRSAG
jgi:hypothetical protein